MNFQTSVAECRAAASNPNPDHRDGMLIEEALTERRDLLAYIAYRGATENRGRLASEQRTHDQAENEIRELEQLAGVTANLTASAADRANQARSKLPVPLTEFGSSPRQPADLGDRFLNAINEVRDGAGIAYVDFEERAVSEGGSGGYGVPIQFAQPVQALAARSVVLNLPGAIQVSVEHGDRVRFPRFNAVTVSGSAEAATLPAAATDVDAIDIVFQKFATYETLSTELEEDFSAPALQSLGDRMLRDLAARVDLGLLEGTGASDIVGLFSQSGVSTTSVAGLPADFDKVSEAVFQLEANDGEATAWIMHPRSWRILKQIKTGLASDKTTLLEPSPQQAPKTLAGLPVFTSSAISIVSGATTAGSTAALVDASQIVIATRRAPRLEVSRDVAFATDSIAVRATTRVGLGVIDPAGGVSLLTDIRAS